MASEKDTTRAKANPFAKWRKRPWKTDPAGGLVRVRMTRKGPVVEVKLQGVWVPVRHTGPIYEARSAASAIRLHLRTAVSRESRRSARG